MTRDHYGHPRLEPIAQELESIQTLLENQEDALLYGGPVPGADRPLRPSDLGGGTLTDALDSVLESVVAREEELYRRAIRETDWEETAVLRVIRYPPEPTLARSGRYDTDGEPEYRMDSEYEIQRFEERVPDAGYDLECEAEVSTITRPLLRRLAAQNRDVVQLLEEAGLDG